MPVGVDFSTRLATVRLWDGSPLPAGLSTRLEREYAVLGSVKQQIKEVVAERAEKICMSTDLSVQKVWSELMSEHQIVESVCTRSLLPGHSAPVEVGYSFRAHTRVSTSLEIAFGNRPANNDSTEDAAVSSKMPNQQQVGHLIFSQENRS